MPEYSDLYLKSRARMQLEFGQEQMITVPKWMVQWVGDYPAAILLNQILYHTSRKPDGWFYKSYPAWLNELVLTESQVRRCVKTITKLDLGLDTKLAMVSGSNTTHYRIDPIKFWQAYDGFLSTITKPETHPVNQQVGEEAPPTMLSVTPQESLGCHPHESGGSITIEDSTSEYTKEKESSGAENPAPTAPEVEKPKRRASKKSKMPPKRNKETHNKCLEKIAQYSKNFNPELEQMSKTTASYANKALGLMDAIIPEPTLTASDVENIYRHFRITTNGSCEYPTDYSKIEAMARQWRDDGKPEHLDSDLSSDDDEAAFYAADRLANPQDYMPDEDIEPIPYDPNEVVICPVGRVWATGSPRFWTRQQLIGMGYDHTPEEQAYMQDVLDDQQRILASETFQTFLAKMRVKAAEGDERAVEYVRTFEEWEVATEETE